MRNYLLPFLLLFFIACEKENEVQEEIQAPNESKAICLLNQEYYLSSSDTSTKVVLASYVYDDNGLIMIDQTLSQGGDPMPDTATLIVWENGHPAYSLKTENGQSDTLEKYTYDAEGRLSEINYFVYGHPLYMEKMIYRENELIGYTWEEGAKLFEYEVKSRDGLIREIILKSSNGNPVDSNFYRQIIYYDDKNNPLYKTHTGNFNYLEYFNNRNVTQLIAYQDGAIKTSRSYEISYEYDDFGNPIKALSQTANSTATYSSYDCAFGIN